jgi:hypothetical protein
VAGKDKDKKREDAAREAALWDPDSVFHDYATETTSGRAIQALTASDEVPEAPEPDKPEGLYARKEARRTGALTKEMIKRMADRAEQAARKKR